MAVCMIAVILPIIILNFLFVYKPKSLLEEFSGEPKSLKVKRVIGVVLAVLLSVGLVIPTIIVSTNMTIELSNDICLTILCSFINDFTLTQIIKSSIQGLLIWILRRMKNPESGGRKLLLKIVNPNLLKIFNMN